MTDGEVAVRRGSTTTAVSLPELDGTIAVDLRDPSENPHVLLPDDATVGYHEDIRDRWWHGHGRRGRRTGVRAWVLALGGPDGRGAGTVGDLARGR